MSSNTFGKEFCVTTWGESHGPAVGCVVDGCPAGLEVSLKDIQKDLDRRRPGASDISTPRKEKDRVQILSGIFESKTLGTPISLLIENKNVDSSAYKPLKDKPRPGHADYTWQAKFGFRDWRGGGRASARETVGRVAAGSIAKRLLSSILETRVLAYTKEIGGIRAKDTDTDELDVYKAKDKVYSNPVRALDTKVAKEMEDAIKAVKAEGDSLGGIIECVAVNVPAGLGEPVFDKLTADLAKAVMSIPAVKGVEFGTGFAMARMKGSKANDHIVGPGRRLGSGFLRTRTNNSGGINGGISNGMPIVLRAAVKPTSSIAKEQGTVDLRTGENVKIKIKGKHDPCVVPRAVPIVEAMVSLVLVDHELRSGHIPRSLA